MTNTWPPKNEIEWFATQSEDYYPCGPFKRKRDAVEAGKEYFGSESFMVIKTLAKNIDLSTLFNLREHFINADLYYMLDEDDDGGDELGNNHPLDEPTRVEWKELEAEIKQTIKKWQRRNRLKLRSYYCGDVLKVYEVKE